MQFSKSAGKHWTELPLSLSFIFLRRALYPPSPFTPLDLSLAALYPRPSTNSLSGRRRHIHSLSLSLSAFQTVGYTRQSLPSFSMKFKAHRNSSDFLVQLLAARETKFREIRFS